MAAEKAVSFAVENLSTLLIQKAVFLKGVKGDVEWLKSELKMIQFFLKDAMNKQSESEFICNWISEIKEVAHDAQDTIEEFVLYVQSRGVLERYTHCFNHMYHLNKVGKMIQSIRERLREIEQCRVRYGIQALGEVESRSRSRSQLEIEARRRVSYWQDDKHLVGLENDVKLLLEQAIFTKSESLSVTSILGMGGIGKSSLAVKIYNHPAVTCQFQLRLWVVVSSEFTTEDIMKQMLLQLGISSDLLKLLESVDDRLARQGNLKKELHTRLTGKQYFIVLDDVWEGEHWESLSNAFPNEDKSSRLLVTSRNQIMKKYDGYAHNMKVLNAQHSRELFLRKAIVGNNTNLPEELKNIGEEILKKCGGIPLAVSMVGGLLAKKERSIRAWENVLSELKYHMDRIDEINIMSAILELSYNNLSSQLKVCFLCLGFFKEDASIEVEDLIHVWVAQGLVQRGAVGEGETVEDVARHCLNELISRNMVQIKKIEYDNVKVCIMHDLLSDLAMRKAMEELDLEVVREERGSYQSLNKPRHRALYFNRPSFIYSINRNQYIRSLFIYGETECTDFGSSSYWKNFELLAVLNFGDAKFKVLPKAIGLITGLKYLKLIYTGERSKLPSSWGMLRNLEVLVLLCDYPIIILNKVLLKMDSMRYLYAHICDSKVALGNMTTLERLSLFMVQDSDVWQIQGAIGLSELGIDMSGMSNVSMLFTYLATLEKLVFLILTKYTKPLIMEGLGNLHHINQLTLNDFPNLERLPDDFPPNLSYLTLSDVSLMDDPMPVLGKLSKLLYLNLSRAYKGEEMVVWRTGFSSLKVLHLESLYKLRNIEIEEDAMPELNQLITLQCQNLIITNLSDRIQRAIVAH